MHIQFRKIRYKNILSVGNQFIEIDFEKEKTTIISGTNGSGKSTMIEAIVFALFAKPFRRINKPQLVNTVNNKDLLVELEFSISSKTYVVRRGMKPTIFEIWENGVLINKDAASKDYQEQFEQTILKMTYKSFTQIVILGSATYVPFMELPAGQRREIIEDLLDIQIFSVMNQLLKDKVTINKELVTAKSHEIELIKTKLDAAKMHNLEVKKLKQTEVDKLKIKVSTLLKEMEETKEEIEKLETRITELSATIFDKQKNKQSIEKIKTLLYDLTSKRKTYNSEIQFYSQHSNCPTCKQGIDDSFKHVTIDEKTKKEAELYDAISALEAKQSLITERLDTISTVEDEIQNYHNSANEKRLNNKIIIDQLRSIKQELDEAEKDVKEIDETSIKNLSTDLAKLQADQTILYEQREIMSVVLTMLKDGGIKTSIIKTYIPIMNRIINQYLSEFELFVDFNLNEDFTEVIKSRFRDAFSFSSFSEGEKLRISLSIMFAWRALAKLRNSVSTNLLILDEVLDSGTDIAGVESLIDILKNLNQNDNVFVISHRGDLFRDRFDRYIGFSKVKNFTEMTIE